MNNKALQEEKFPQLKNFFYFFLAALFKSSWFNYWNSAIVAQKFTVYNNWIEFAVFFSFPSTASPTEMSHKFTKLGIFSSAVSVFSRTCSAVLRCVNLQKHIINVDRIVLLSEFTTEIFTRLHGVRCILFCCYQTSTTIFTYYSVDSIKNVWKIALAGVTSQSVVREKGITRKYF